MHPGLTLARLASCVALLLCAGVLQAREDARVDRYLEAVAQRLPAQSRDALAQVNGMPRRLLAARGYLRAGASLAGRWSWSEQQIEDYQASEEYRALLEEIGRVRERFEARNPGYSLYANTQIRDLGQQLQRWNENPTVARIADALEDAAIRELSANYPARPDETASARFAEFLRTWQLPAALPLASPGLSLHGQLRAVDFQVTRGAEVIAPTETASVARIWVGQGWARKLKEAVAGSRFSGPIQVPNEPWHYEYVRRPDGDAPEQP